MRDSIVREKLANVRRDTRSALRLARRGDFCMAYYYAGKVRGRQWSFTGAVWYSLVSILADKLFRRVQDYYYSHHNGKVV